jgi:mRNA interferase RelE/StbE
LNTQFKESFLKDLRAIKDRDLLARVNEIIEAVEKAQTPQEIPTLKKLRGDAIISASELAITDSA